MTFNRFRISKVAGILLLAFSCLVVSPESIEPFPSSITVTTAHSPNLSIGETRQLDGAVLDQFGLQLADADINWVSSNPEIAEISSDGVVVGKASGTATIIATAFDLPSTSFVLSVADPAYTILVALYYATNGEAWHHSDNWLSASPLNAWHGVDTDSKGQVVGITLSANNLAGRIPRQLGDLSELTQLDLSSNRLTGSIPRQLGHLNNLRELDLSVNELSGEIPTDLGDLSNLNVLHLGYNEFDGTIPVAFGRLAELTHLDLSSNQLSGSIPISLGQLERLQELRLSYNELSGPIPSELGELAHLEVLLLNDNALTRKIPPKLGQLSNLAILWLSHNKLQGNLPEELGQLNSLVWLLVNDNRLIGTMPLSFQQLPLEVFSFSGTKLCVPKDDSFQAWLRAIPYHSTVSADCERSIADSHATLVAGLPDKPFTNRTVGGSEGSTSTMGSLQIDSNLDAFPVIINQEDDGETVLVAASIADFGRVVAFSAQDFIGSDDRATLLGHEHMNRLLANAVNWSAPSDATSLRVLVDNQRIADALEGQGFSEIQIIENGNPDWLRTWSTDALEDVDVAVVQINEWGTPRVTGDSSVALRTFVQEGGGLVIAGSAMHWSWWIERNYGPFAGNVILAGSGISWNEDHVELIASATTKFDLRSLAPAVVWQDYVNGGNLSDAELAKLPNLFNAALELDRYDELDAALTRLVAEAPELPTPSDDPMALLLRDIGETLGPYDWPEPHPWAAIFPGLPDADATLVDGSVTIDASLSEFPTNALRYRRFLPLGFYAPPSTRVTIEVPETAATGSLAVVVGQFHDDLRNYTHQDIWRRAPHLVRSFPIVSEQTEVTNAYGGSIALYVPDFYTGTIPIEVSSAIPMAVYTEGQTTIDEWHEQLNQGAPQAILQTIGGIRLIVSTESARKVENPGDVMSFWSDFYRHHEELGCEPGPRAYESIWLFDPQVGWGYANANDLRINYRLDHETWALMPGTEAGKAWIATLPDIGPLQYRHPPPDDYDPVTDRVDWWLFGHELGHQWQTSDWGHYRFRNTRDITEVAVNLFTLYTLNHYLYHGTDHTHIGRVNRSTETLDHDALAKLSWADADFGEKLMLYRQLIEAHGWTALKQVFCSYYDDEYPRTTYGSEYDGFAIRFSAISERDLVRFFQTWEYPMSGTAVSTIRSFELDEWLPPGW